MMRENRVSAFTIKFSAAPNKFFHYAQPRIERHCDRRPYDKLRAFDPEGGACHERGPHGPSRMKPKDTALGLVPRRSLPCDKDPDVKKLICRGARLLFSRGVLLLCLFLLHVLNSFSDIEAQPRLVEDINSGESNTEFLALKGFFSSLYFVTFGVSGDGQANYKLWKKSPGIPPVVVTDGLVASSLIHAGNKLFFFKKDTASAFLKLWWLSREESPQMVVDGRNFDQSSAASSVAAGDEVYSIINGNLYRTTESGTRQILVQSGYPAATSLTPAGNIIFFARPSNYAPGALHTQLWKSDGTEAGTSLVKEFTQTDSNGQIKNLSSHGSYVFFTVNDGIHGIELWRSDGSSAGTEIVSDINNGLADSSPSQLLSTGSGYSGNFYFTASDGSTGRQLWTVVSPLAALKLTDNIPQNTARSEGLIDMAPVGSQLFFITRSFPQGGLVTPSLWISGGTPESTHEVISFAEGTTGDFYLTGAGNLAFFTGVFPSGQWLPPGYELFRSDGTASGTFLVEDINTAQQANGAPGSCNPRFLTYVTDEIPVNNTLYFVCDDGVHGRELWELNTNYVPPLTPTPSSTPTPVPDSSVARINLKKGTTRNTSTKVYVSVFNAKGGPVSGQPLCLMYSRFSDPDTADCGKNFKTAKNGRKSLQIQWGAWLKKAARKNGSTKTKNLKKLFVWACTKDMLHCSKRNTFVKSRAKTRQIQPGIYYSSDWHL